MKRSGTKRDTNLPMADAALDMLATNVEAHVKQAQMAPGPLYNHCCRWTRDHGAATHAHVLALRARVAELERQVAYEREQCAAAEAVAMNRGIHANALRDALVKCEDEWRKLGGPLSAWPKGDGRRDTARELADECAAALASTPAASLAAHNAALIERCATAAESYLWNLPAIQSQVGANCGDAIRALAAQEVKP